MNKFFKSIGYSMAGIAGVIILFIIPILAVGGGLWFFDNFYQAMGCIALAVLALSVMLILLSIIPTLRIITGTGLYAISFILGGIFWLTCMYTVYSVWGLLGVIFGIVFFKAVFVPAVLAVLLDFKDPLQARLITLVILVLAMAIIYGLRFFGIWIIDKFKPQTIKKPSLRYPVAVIVAMIAGYLLPMPVFSAIDYLISGGKLITTNINVPLNWLVVLYMIAIGLITGFLAGFIAEKRGKLIAAIAQFTPLVLLVLLTIIMNVDFLSQASGQTRPATWTWVGLIPAIIAGHYGQKWANELKANSEDMALEDIQQ